jgi:thiol-disulfide isomerase/thioredoxin
VRSDTNLPLALRANGQKWGEDNSFDLIDRSNYRLSFSGGERDHLFISTQGKRFTDVYGLSGLDSPSDGRGFAILDFDRDGRPDVAVVNSNTPRLDLFHNEIGGQGGDRAAGNYIAVRFLGGNRGAESNHRFSNRDGFGAKVLVRAGDSTLLREHRCGEGFSAQNTPTMLIGLGPHRSASSVSIHWPSGTKQEIADVPAGTLLSVFENPADGGDQDGIAREPYARPMPLVRRQPEQSPPRFQVAALSQDSTLDPTIAPKLRVYTTMATWCPSCKKHLPQLEMLRNAFDPQTLELYGLPIDSEDTPRMLREYVARYQPAYRLIDSLTAEDRAALQSVLLTQVMSEALPATIVTNAAGEIVYAATGVATVSDLRRLLALQQLAPDAHGSR